MQVPLLDLKPQYGPLAAEIQAVIQKVCASQAFILGPAVKELEAAVASYCQCRFGIGVSSGTDALLLALMALEIGAGDAVITTPFTFFATAGTIARTGAVPLFCDIDPATFNISPAAIRALLESRCERRDGGVFTRQGARVKALMPVHLYGRLADMHPLMEIAHAFGLKVIEDAAQAIGTEGPDGRRAGSFGDVGCLSLFPTKNLGAFGDAGMCLANDPRLADSLDILRVHGGKPN
jgi:dTDP-4-amino-4,6-dideoxygalactose transaminase